MKLGDTLRELREEKRLSQRALAHRIGKSQSYYSLLESGSKIPSEVSTLKRLSEVLGVDYDLLRQLIDEDKTEVERQQVIERAKSLNLSIGTIPIEQNGVTKDVQLRRVPILNSVPAGDLVGYGDMDYPAGWADDYTEVPYVIKELQDPNLFALTIEGDSMEPLLMAGDVVFISPNASVENGQVACVAAGDRKAIKKVHCKEDHIVLQSLNPQYEPIILSAKDKPKIIGRVVWMQRRIS